MDKYVNIEVPYHLRGHAGGRDIVVGEGDTVGECLRFLEAAYPGLAGRFLRRHSGGQKLAPFLNVYLDAEDISLKRGLRTPVTGGQTLVVSFFDQGG